MSDNINPSTEEEVKQVIEQTLENAGLRAAPASVHASADTSVQVEEPDPEMDAYLARFESLTRLTNMCKRVCDEANDATFLSTGDKKLLAVISMQDELLRAIVEQMAAMNNIFAR